MGTGTGTGTHVGRPPVEGEQPMQNSITSGGDGAAQAMVGCRTAACIRIMGAIEGPNAESSAVFGASGMGSA